MKHYNIEVDNVQEITPNHGVTIDGVTLKNGGDMEITGGSNAINIVNGTASIEVAENSYAIIASDLIVSGDTVLGGTASDVEALEGSNNVKIITPITLKYVLDTYQPGENLIGIPGNQGFGVGICPSIRMPVGMEPLSGHNIRGNSNYGNYVFRDGSIMVWIPKFYYRINHVSNPTYGEYGVNSVDIKGTDTYTTTEMANDDGYALHRAFIDGGVEQPGFFVDKYKCSKNAWGTGFIGSSIPLGVPVLATTAIPGIGFTDLTGGVTGNYGAIDLAHRRDGLNGNVATSSNFFVSSVFIGAAVELLSLAHAQASTSTTNCAWYMKDPDYNFPKGCCNGALGNWYDPTITWIGNGYSYPGAPGQPPFLTCYPKTGSGSPFAKTTHNGQDCGIADPIGGNREIRIGSTTLGTAKPISGITRANPCVVTANNHGFLDGSYITLGGIPGQYNPIEGMVEVSDRIFTIAVKTIHTFELVGINSSNYTPYTQYGCASSSSFYISKEITAMKSYTNGESSATDHFGLTGVSNNMSIFYPPIESGMGKNLLLENCQRFGSEGNQIFSADISGSGWLLTGAGFPKDLNAIDNEGALLVGKSLYNMLNYPNILPIGSGDAQTWVYSTGIFYKSYSNISISQWYDTYRCACYPTY